VKLIQPVSQKKFPVVLSELVDWDWKIVHLTEKHASFFFARPPSLEAFS
jgi:hypothetical protein